MRMLQQKSQCLFLSAILIFSIVPGVTPRAKNTRSMDDSLLLFIASQVRLAKREGVNEVTQLMERYRGYLDHVEKSDFSFTGREEVVRQMLEDELESKLQELSKDAVKLDNARQRRKKKNLVQKIFGGLKKLVKGGIKLVGKVTVGAVQIAGKILKWVIEEELPRQLKQILLGRIDQLKALIQGRIDLFWDKLAERWGGPFAQFLRSKIDPIFVRTRDHILVKFRLKGKSEPTEDILEFEFTEEDFSGWMSWTDFLTIGGYNVRDPQSVRVVWGTEAGKYEYTLQVPAWHNDKCVPPQFNDSLVKRNFQADVDELKFSLGFGQDSTISGKFGGKVLANTSRYVHAGSFEGRIVKGEWEFDETGFEYSGAVSVSLNFSESNITAEWYSWGPGGWIIRDPCPEELHGARAFNVNITAVSRRPEIVEVSGTITGNQYYLSVICEEGPIQFNLLGDVKMDVSAFEGFGD